MPLSLYNKVEVTECGINRHSSVSITIVQSLMLMTLDSRKVKQNKAQRAPVESTQYVFTHMPGESYSRRLGSLLLLVCRLALIKSLVC